MAPRSFCLPLPWGYPERISAETIATTATGALIAFIPTFMQASSPTILPRCKEGKHCCHLVYKYNITDSCCRTAISDTFLVS